MTQSWVGIRFSAALSILGSFLTLVLAGLIGATAMFSPLPRDEGVPLKPVMLVLAVFFLGLTLWGMWTGIGILKRRAWARASIVIFAVLLAGMGGSALVAVLFVPMPATAQVNPRMLAGIRGLIAAFYGGLLLTGTWWLLLFNSQGAKRYFAESGAVEARAPERARPLSIQIIGWLLLVWALGTGVAAALRIPALFFGTVVTGWASLGVNTVYTAVEIYLGTGLLQFQRAARAGAIVYLAFIAANNVVSCAVPGLGERLQFAMQWMRRFAGSREVPLPANIAPLVLMGTLLVLIPIWFLLRRKESFR